MHLIDWLSVGWPCCSGAVGRVMVSMNTANSICPPSIKTTLGVITFLASRRHSLAYIHNPFPQNPLLYRVAWRGRAERRQRVSKGQEETPRLFPGWHPIPYILLLSPEPWSKVVLFKGNNVQFGGLVPHPHPQSWQDRLDIYIESLERHSEHYIEGKVQSMGYIFMRLRGSETTSV